MTHPAATRKASFSMKAALGGKAQDGDAEEVGCLAPEQLARGDEPSGNESYCRWPFELSMLEAIQSVQDMLLECTILARSKPVANSRQQSRPCCCALQHLQQSSSLYTHKCTVVDFD